MLPHSRSGNTRGFIEKETEKHLKMVREAATGVTEEGAWAGRAPRAKGVHQVEENAVSWAVLHERKEPGGPWGAQTTRPVIWSHCSAAPSRD